MEFDAKKIVQDIFKDICSGGTLVDFNPAQAMIIDGTSIFGDKKSWYLHNKEENMEKKKMTKAEAFEWLKCKKVSVSTRETGRKVQSKLFDCGVIWKNGGTDFCDYGNYYVINSHGLLGHCDGMGSYWECLINEEISADDILSIEIVEDTKQDCERNEHVKALQELIAKSGCIDCIIISKNDIGILKK